MQFFILNHQERWKGTGKKMTLTLTGLFLTAGSFASHSCMFLWILETGISSHAATQSAVELQLTSCSGRCWITGSWEGGRPCIIWHAKGNTHIPYLCWSVLLSRYRQCDLSGSGRQITSYYTRASSGQRKSCAMHAVAPSALWFNESP